MKALVIHAAKDLRIEEMQAGSPGPGQVGVPFRPAASVVPICIITITAASAPCGCANR